MMIEREAAPLPLLEYHDPAKQAFLIDDDTILGGVSFY